MAEWFGIDRSLASHWAIVGSHAEKLRVAKELYPKFKPTEMLGLQTLSVKAASVEIEARPAIEGDWKDAYVRRPNAWLGARSKNVKTALWKEAPERRVAEGVKAEMRGPAEAGPAALISDCACRACYLPIYLLARVLE